MTLEVLESRLKDLIGERDNFAIAANQELAFYNGRIKEIELLIESLKPKESDADE